MPNKLPAEMLGFLASAQPCIVKWKLLYSGKPEREGQMPSPPLSILARCVDAALTFPILLR